MATAATLNSSPVPNANLQAPAPETQADANRRAEAIASVNKIVALSVLAFAAVVITLSCLTMPFPAALVVSLVTAAITLPIAAALLCECRGDYTVVDHRPPRTYFYHRWFLDPIYVDPYYRPPIVVNRPVYVRPSFPQPHVVVGGGHSWFPRTVPNVRVEPHVRVGGGHSRPVSSMRTTPPIRVHNNHNGGGGIFGGGGHRSVPSMPMGRSSGGHTVVGGRRR